MCCRSTAYCDISVTGGDPNNHADNEARSSAIITGTLDGDNFHYPPEERDIVEYDHAIAVYFGYTDSTIYELAQALLATLRNLVDDGWTIIDVDVKRSGIDGRPENPDIETWTILDGHIFASNYVGAIGSIRRYVDMWEDSYGTTVVTAGTAIVTEHRFSAKVADARRPHRRHLGRRRAGTGQDRRPDQPRGLHHLAAGDDPGRTRRYHRPIARLISPRRRRRSRQRPCDQHDMRRAVRA